MKDNDTTYCMSQTGEGRMGHMSTDKLPEHNCSNCNSIITKPLHPTCMTCVYFSNWSEMTKHRLDNRK